MIPRLLPADTTNFNTAGISLTDAISCTVTEERNGVFTLEMVIATTTPYFDQIMEGMLIVAKPNHTQTLQAFEICKISKPINQKVTINANHISYKQSFIPVEPFSCTGITETLQGLVNHSLETNPFTFNTTITNETSTYNQIEPASLRSRLGGTEGSVLDVYGGEFLWDNYTTSLLLHRGSDNGVELRVGKNITDLEQNTELDSVVTGVLPYWSNTDDTEHFYGDIQYNSDVNNYAYHRTVVLDLSDEFDSAPSADMLNAAGQEYVSQANLGLPSTNITLSYVDLADTEEYKDSILERTNLCDTVQVTYTPLNISYKAKVIKLVFDVLGERTQSVEIGNAKSTISKTITDLVGDVSSVVKTGKKLVSVTQKIDRELGEVSTTVASVQEQTANSANMLLDTNAPSLEKVYADYNRRIWTPSSAIRGSIVPISNSPSSSVSYGAQFEIIGNQTAIYDNTLQWYLNGVVKMSSGTQYTLTCYARATVLPTNPQYLYLTMHYGQDYHGADETLVVHPRTPRNETYTITSTDWVKYSWTFVADSRFYEAEDGANVRIGVVFGSVMAVGTTVQICDFYMMVGEPSGVETKGSTLKISLDGISQEVSNVQQNLNTTNENLTKVDVKADGITTKISNIQTDIKDNYYTKTETTQIVEDKADSLTRTFATKQEVDGVKTEVHTMIRESGDGIDIGKSNSEFIGHFDNDSLDFIKSDTTLAWVDATDGLGGSQLSVGDYKEQDNRWRIFTRQEGSHLSFTRHKSS